MSYFYTRGNDFMCFFSYKSLLGYGSTVDQNRRQELEAGILVYYYASTQIAEDELIEHDGHYYKRRYAPMRLKKVYKMDLTEVYNITALGGS